jgi:predicted ATP-dependent Lon-type protease
MDSIVTRIIDRFKSRAEMGNKKYNTDLDRKDLTVGEWIQHLQDELHDAYLYSEKLKVEHSIIRAEDVKQLMDEWISELNFKGVNLSADIFVASFHAFMLRKQNQ